MRRFCETEKLQICEEDFQWSTEQQQVQVKQKILEQKAIILKIDFHISYSVGSVLGLVLLAQRIYKIFNFNNSMRLQLQLDKIHIDPICHLQLLRHAEQFQGKNNIYGQLYGALLDSHAQVTSILPLPEGSKTTKEELEGMEKRNDELLGTFNLDSEKIGWYLICYTRNFWDSLETMKYYENYINTSFFLIFDYKARIEGRIPYKAFRLKDDFALKENFKWSDLQHTNLEKDNPLEEIPVIVQKNEFFELMMLWNKQQFLKGFEQSKRKESTYQTIRKNVEQYLSAFEVREQIQKEFNDNFSKSPEGDKVEKSIPFEEYCEYIGQVFKLNNYENFFNQYLQDNEKYEQLFEAPTQ